MLRKIAKFLLRSLLFAILAAALLIGGTHLAAQSYSQPRLYTVESAIPTPVAIIFGAGLDRNGTPSAVLRDRLEIAAQLYRAGKVKKLLMSGDNRFVDYNEPGAMRDYAVSLGVPEEDIVLDFAGRRTYDTCYRARHIFAVSEAILVTQNFHMPRALVTCNNLGVQSTGVPAEKRRYLRRYYAFWIIRELPATTVALWEVWVARPLPVLGNPEPIFSVNTRIDPIPHTTP